MEKKYSWQAVVNNEFSQPIGAPVNEWQGARVPQCIVLSGESVQLVPLALTHQADLWRVIQAEPDASCWTYLPYGPFADQIEFNAWLEKILNNPDNLMFAIQVGSNILGWIALMRIDANAGSIEIGHVYYSSALRHTKQATESVYLLLKYAFSLGFRRCEWKCNDFNEPSKKAATRFGFQFEGVFRQDRVIKGHNRNTAWFSMLDEEWQHIQPAMQQWLSTDNFDQNHQQRRALREFM